MATTRKQIWDELLTRGWEPQYHYRDYTAGRLLEELNELDPEKEWTVEDFAASERGPEPPTAAQADPDEMPGQRLNTQRPDEVIRVDDKGRQWLQEEVPKPAYPKPRGRRVLTYMETGTEEQTVRNGEYTETFEIAGKGRGRPSEVKITLPSYQVGIYKDPRFPFRVHTYDGREGFNLQDVQKYYGGAEMVPATCKRIYIENDLCYEPRSVIRTIQDEYRHMQLTGRLK